MTNPMRTLANVSFVVGIAFCTWGCSSDESSPDLSMDATIESVDEAASIADDSASTDATDSLTPDGPTLDATDGETTVAGTQPEGFTTIEARVTAADGEVCEVCLWLADTDEERGRGLMGVTDLGAAGGMAFVFDPATTGAFYMFQTPTPLSIAWFGESGAWVGAAEMAPCLDPTPQACALYSPNGAAYTVGVETFAGGLEPLLLVEGSVIELIEGTENLECQTPSS